MTREGETMTPCALRMSSVASGLRPFAMVFFALTMILLFGSSRASADTLDTYVFSGASAVLGVAPFETVALETITGGFTFDTTTNKVSAVDITLTGNSAYAGTFTASSLSDGGLPFDILNPVVNSGVTAFINLTFASDFGASPDALVGFNWISTSGGGGSGVPTNDLQGEIVITGTTTTTVPEPSSGILLLVPLVATVGFLTRRDRAVAKRIPQPTA
jgi:hypothetical protein